MAHSCNVYFYRLALLLGADRLSEYALKFGLGRPSGVDLPYETSGNVPSVLNRRMKLRSWYDGDTANFGIGQGDLLVSPIQTVRLMAALANGGSLVRPYIVEKVGEEGRAPQDALNLKIDPGTLDSVNEGIKEVVNLDTGTANIGDWKGLKVAGKTGTAQVQGRLSHGWFAGFFPYDKPKVAFVYSWSIPVPASTRLSWPSRYLPGLKKKNSYEEIPDAFGGPVDNLRQLKRPLWHDLSGEPLEERFGVPASGAVDCLGLAGFFVFSKFYYRGLINFVYPFYALVIISLVLVLFLGGARLGAQRWIKLWWFNFQPSEFAKLAVILVFSLYFSRKGLGISGWISAAFHF